MFAIVDSDGNLCPFATKYYKTSNGAKKGFTHARESVIRREALSSDSPALRNGYFKWVHKSGLHPQDCIGKNFQPKVFAMAYSGGNLSREEADALSVKFDEFTNQYEIREVEMKLTVK